MNGAAGLCAAGTTGMVAEDLRAPGVPAPVICADGLCKVINGRSALTDIGLRVGPGESIALLGANGAGKSTLLRVLATLIAPTRGDLRLFGESAGARSAARRARIGLVSHQLMLYRDLTPLENLELFGVLYGVAGARERARRLLELFGIDARADDAVRSLSRGTAQRVAIARALMHDPELLLLDEPYTGLDRSGAQRLDECLGSFHAAGRTLIVAHHDLRRALAQSERTLVLRDGRLILDAPSSRVGEHDAALVAGGPS